MFAMYVSHFIRMGMSSTFAANEGSLLGTVEITTSRKVYTGFVKNVTSTRFEFRLGTLLSRAFHVFIKRLKLFGIFLFVFVMPMV